MAESRLSLRETQYGFASAIRCPDQPPPPGVPQERMDLYRDLFFNNIQSFIANGFPVLHELLDPEAWESLIRDFLARHRCSAPYFCGIPAEFLAFLRDERGAHPDDPPFLLELAHYEWVELALSIAETETPPASPELKTEPLRCSVALSPNVWLLSYRFPVHRICRDFQPDAPPAEPTCIAVYRDCGDTVRFLEINPATYRLLDRIQAEPGLPALDYLAEIALELGHTDASPLLGYGTDLLRDLADRAIIGAV